MHLGRARLCLVVSCLAVLNFFVFLVFPPKQWKFGQIFTRIPHVMNLSLVQNATIVSYGPNLQQNIAPAKECWKPVGLAVGNIAANLVAAEENYWTASNAQSPNVTANETTDFLGFQDQDNSTAIFEPTNCVRPITVAIIIPFRDRESHLRILLGHLVPILRKQLLRYSIFVMEQAGDGTFNKGRLMNTGFEFASETGKRSGMKYGCFIFQDVDLLVEHEALIYRCGQGQVVSHLSTTIDKFDYKPLCCGMTVGGVLGFRESHFRKVNGYPNSYWGWGGEDDDINKRIRYRGLKIVRPKPPLGSAEFEAPFHDTITSLVLRCRTRGSMRHRSRNTSQIAGVGETGRCYPTQDEGRIFHGGSFRLKSARYTMIKHGPDKGNPYNNNVHRNVQFALRRIRQDGLSNLNTRIVGVENYPLFTKVIVDVGEPR